ncbi:MAG: acetate--CoA ligase family protein, partial [Planktomarina sp.]
GAGIWPDQHGCRSVDRGVAILTQSSNIAINLTMQNRGLPIGYVVACGNQAQTTQAQVGMQLLDDPRVTAIGLHIEGFGDLRGWEALANKARDRNIPLIALKSGKSDQAQAAAISHTASLAGGDAAAQTFLDRNGIRRVSNLPVFLEALKLSHMFGTMDQATIASISCSGGEAALAADTALKTGLEFPPLNDRQRADLGAALGPMVALANPLDYHTYIWRDQAAMTAAWAAMADPAIGITLLISDYPRADICDPSDWDIATAAAIDAAKQTGRRYAVVASLPELMPETTAKHLMDNGVAAMNGLDHTIDALAALTRPMPLEITPVLLPGPDRASIVLSEYDAKQDLKSHGVPVPNGQRVADRSVAADAAEQVGFPVAVKVLGLAHKTGASGLSLGLTSGPDVLDALPDLAPGDLLIEHMISGGVAEVLVGVTRDPAHGFLLTIAAGGTLTEILDDSISLLVPASRDHVKQALSQLKMAPILHGYRGKPAVDMESLLDAIQAVQAYVLANSDRVEEVEINPLICTPTGA